MTNLIYTASNGREFNLTADMSMRVKKAQFHAFSYTPDVSALRYGARVNGWTKEAAEYSAQIVFKGSKAARLAALNTFHEAIERDLIYKTPGILTWGNSYISCYLRSSGTYPADENDIQTLNDVDIYCPSPFWVTEQKVVIDPVEQQQILRETDIQYAPSYGYPYSYMQYMDTSKSIYVDHFAPCNFQVILYGPVNTVDISIGDLSLKVDRAIPAGGRMIIDTRDSVNTDKHCYIVSNGNETNCFNYRSPDSNLLEKIAPGFKRVHYGRTTRLELTIFKERSEPAWIS